MKANRYGEADEDTRCKMNFVAGVVKVDGKELLMDNGKPLEYQPFEVAQNLTGSKYIKTAGARMAKYEVDRTSYMDGKLQSNDIVLFRYADVLLMKAEAKVRLGENGDVELNRIRARVGMPNRKATLANILEERLLELVWEGWRRQTSSVSASLPQLMISAPHFRVRNLAIPPSSRYRRNASI